MAAMVHPACCKRRLKGCLVQGKWSIYIDKHYLQKYFHVKQGSLLNCGIRLFVSLPHMELGGCCDARNGVVGRIICQRMVDI